MAIVKHAHTPTGGAEDALADYLRPKIAALAMLAHPFPRARAVSPESRWQLWNRGKLITERLGWRGRGPDVMYYLRDVFETLRTFLRGGERWDVYVGVDNLNASVGILLRTLGRVRTVVFYVIDYVPQRFSNPLLNRLYHALDRFAARRADCVWNLNEAMADARAAAGLPQSKAAPQVVVPMGAMLTPSTGGENPKPTAVYLGHLTPEQGVDLLLEAWAEVGATLPEAVLRIIGSGEQEASLKKQAERLGLNESVEWLGFVPDDMLHEAMASCWVAVAPYPALEQGYKRFADPAKLRQYCAAGLPVVMTTTPHAAERLQQEGVALAVAPTREGVAEALVTLLSDADRRSAMGKAASRVAQSYTWDKIFDTAWRESLPCLEKRWGRR